MNNNKLLTALNVDAPEVTQILKAPGDVVETVGSHAPTLAQALEIVRPAAKVVVLGLWDDLVPIDSWQAILKDVTLLFCLNHGVVGNRADYELCLDWMASRKVPAQDLVSHVLPLEQLEEGFRLAADKSSGATKVIIRPGVTS